MKAQLVNGNLVITIPATTENLQTSASGKSLIVASTNGNLKTDLKVKDKHVTIGLNAYISVQ